MESKLIFSNTVKELINFGKIEVIENSYTVKNGYARPRYIDASDIMESEVDKWMMKN